MIFRTTQKITNKERNSTMKMIPQNDSYVQESFAEIFRYAPVVLKTDDGNLYFLIGDIDPELERFIYTGQRKKLEYQTLPAAEMEALANKCSQADLTLTYRSHHMIYMHGTATITYPQISCAATGMKIALIPWFVIPDRPFPAFVYAFAAWHYRTTGRSSQQATADATGRLFGIESFSKSTVSRNISVMEDIFGIAIEGSLTPETQDAPSFPELADLILRLLLECCTDEVLDELYGERVRRMPDRKANAEATMDAIPHEYSKVLKPKPPAAKRARRDDRVRPARPRKNRKKPERQRPESVGSAQIDKIRNGFIAIIERIVMYVATAHRRLLTQLGGYACNGTQE